MIPLPSATDPDLDEPIVPCKEVRMDYEIADLTMDPTQDLIVVAEHRYVLTTMVLMLDLIRDQTMHLLRYSNTIF